MKTRLVASWVALFLISLIFAVSCTTSQTPNASNPNANQIGYSAWPGWIPWEVAKEANLFEANKVNTDLKWFDGYLDSINALTAGQLDANCQTLNDTISSVAAGADQVIVLVNDNSNGNDQILVSKDINSIADLKGKKVAVEVGTVDHYLLLLGLQKAGINLTDVETVPLETGAAVAAFVAGRVDAVGAFAPFTTIALQRRGSKVLFSSKDFPGAIPDHLVVSRKLVNERPQDVQALVNTWFDTLDFIRTNREKAYEIMAERAGVTVEEYKQYDAGTKIFSIEENLKAFSPSEDMSSLSYAAKQISEFLVEADLAKQAPDLSKVFDDRFVKAYAAEHKS